MKARRQIAPVVLTVVATWALVTATTAQTVALVGGMFVRDTDGAVYLIRDGERHQVPMFPARPEEIAAVPVSGKWIVPASDGGITVGSWPYWERRDLPSPPEVVVISDVAGQTATGTFQAQTVQVTVREMTVTPFLPPISNPTGTSYPALPAQGKFVVVYVDVENVGKEAVCCMPRFRLRDGKGRFFEGQTETDYPWPKQAMLTLYPTPERRGYFQPNLPFRSVLVFDVAIDASGFRIAAPR